MKDLFTVMEFTIKETIKRKSFIISMLIIIGIIIIGFNVPNIIEAFSKSSDDEKAKILIVDEENIFGKELIKLDTDNEEYEYTITKEKTSQDEIKEKINNEEYNSCFIFKKEENTIKIDYVVSSLSMGESIPEDLLESFQTQYTAVQIQKAGITQEQLQAMFTQFDVNVIQTDENAASGNIFISMMISIALFFAIYFCAYQVSTSITTEKTSKIMETLVTSTSPRTIVLGKTLGIGIVGIAQVIIIVGVTVLSANLFLDAELLKTVFDMSSLTPVFYIATLAYFLLGYFMYAFLYALTGSMLTNPEDIQSANGPIAMIVMIGFYLAYFSMMNPASDINLFAAVFPFSSPFCMPLRILVGSAKTGEIVSSAAILIISIIIIAKISIKIYSSAILNTGTKMNFKSALKILKSKEN